MPRSFALYVNGVEQSNNAHVYAARGKQTDISCVVSGQIPLYKLSLVKYQLPNDPRSHTPNWINKRKDATLSLSYTVGTDKERVHCRLRLLHNLSDNLIDLLIKLTVQMYSKYLTVLNIYNKRELK